MTTRQALISGGAIITLLLWGWCAWLIFSYYSPIHNHKPLLYSEADDYAQHLEYHVPQATFPINATSSLDTLGIIISQELSATIAPPASSYPSANNTAQPIQHTNQAASIQPLPITGTPGSISIIIDDIGDNYARSMALYNAIDASITVSILPYSDKAVLLAQKAQHKGYGVMLHLPMEPYPRTSGKPLNPGRAALLTTDTPEELRAKIAININALMPYIVAVNNHMGSKFTEWDDGMDILMQELKARDIAFLDSITTSRSVAPQAAARADVELLKRNIFIDHYQDEAKIIEYLNKALLRAQKGQHVIAIGHPHPETIAALKIWLPLAQKAGVKLTPITVD